MRPKKRSVIAEILSKRFRLHARGDLWEKFSRRYTPLINGYLDLQKSNVPPASKKELLRYFPIAQVAAMEGLFRLSYQKLIEFGPPYLTNAFALKDLKFGIDSILAIQGRVTSAAEIISHFLPAGSPDEINSSMSALLGEDFFELMKKEKFIPSDSDTPIIVEEFFGGMLERVKFLYYLRHIYCHELATKVKIQPRMIHDIIQASSVFTVIAYQVIEKKLKKS